MGVSKGVSRVPSWNSNSMMKKYKSWVQFISKIKNSSENIFVLVDTRFESEQEREFEKLWDGPIHFNSFDLYSSQHFRESAKAVGSGQAHP